MPHEDGGKGGEGGTGMTNASISHNADWFTTTRDMLNTAIDTRDGALLRRVALRIDGLRFLELPDERQEQLLALYSLAMTATGAFAP